MRPAAATQLQAMLHDRDAQVAADHVGYLAAGDDNVLDAGPRSGARANEVETLDQRPVGRMSPVCRR